MRIDILIAGLSHAAFWMAFTVTLVATRRGVAKGPPGVATIASQGLAPDLASTASTASPASPASPAVAPTVSAPASAPLSRTLVAFHGLGFAVLYAGLAQALYAPGATPASLPRMAAGLALVALAGGLACRTLVHFRSWRLRAALDTGHELATDGPFRLVRHPIYAALDLFALGSAAWLSTPLAWAGVALVVLGGDLRGRAEERLLLQAFGPAYEAYRARTRRLLPGLY